MNPDYLIGCQSLALRLQQSVALLSPPPQLPVSVWADSYRILPEQNAESGRWRTSRAPYQREMMDVTDDPEVLQVTFMTSAQVGKTAIFENIIGKRIDINPDGIIFMNPTVEDAKDWMNLKFEPMVRLCDRLDQKVPRPRSRDKISTQSRKEFPGGFLMLIGSNASRALRGRSAPIIMCDEIDGFEVGKEGDQIELLWNRAKTFFNKILIQSSTPVFTETSNILQAYETSDKRKYFIPCPHCGEMQVLQWKNFRWDSEEVDGRTVHYPETAHFVCIRCAGCIEDRHKFRFLQGGEWRAERPFAGHAGFHIWEGYSPWVKFREIADAFLRAKKKHTLQTFWNTRLGEPWDQERGETLDPESLMARREEYPDNFVPMGGGVICAGVDIQGDRIECQTIAFGRDGERWQVGYEVFYGDTMLPKVWTLLDDHLIGARWKHESGVTLKIEAVGVDAGYLQTKVLEFTGPRRHRNVFAVKGEDGATRPFTKLPPTKIGPRKLPLYIVGVDRGKDLIYTKLKIVAPGPGYIHFNKSRNQEYFDQLTSNKKLYKYKQGFKVDYWELPKGKQDEALDTLNYAEASFDLLNVNLERLFANLHAKANELGREPEPEKTETVEQMARRAKKEKIIRRPQRKKGWMNRY